MPQSHKPRSEPEIIPPGEAAGHIHRTHIYIDADGAEHVYAARLRPFGFILVVLITALLLAVLFALMLATLAIWVPLAILFVGGAVVVRFLRTYFTQTR
jgi:hypothetical protein